MMKSRAVQAQSGIGRRIAAAMAAALTLLLVTVPVGISAAEAQAEAPGGSYGSLVLADSPVSYWPFDGYGPGEFCDQPCLTRDVITGLESDAIGSYPYSVGQVSASEQFLGSHFFSPSTPIINHVGAAQITPDLEGIDLLGATVSGDRSVELWINRSPFDPQPRGNIFEGHGFAVIADPLTSSNSHRRMRVYVDGNSAPIATILDDSGHLAITWDTETVKVYYDGQLRSALPVPEIEPSSNVVRLAGTTDRGLNPGSYLFTGQVDEIAVYDDVLDAGAVLGRFNEVKGTEARVEEILPPGVGVDFDATIVVENISATRTISGTALVSGSGGVELINAEFASILTFSDIAPGESQSFVVGFGTIDTLDKQGAVAATIQAPYQRAASRSFFTTADLLDVGIDVDVDVVVFLSPFTFLGDFGFGAPLYCMSNLTTAADPPDPSNSGDPRDNLVDLDLPWPIVCWPSEAERTAFDTALGTQRADDEILWFGETTFVVEFEDFGFHVLPTPVLP